MTVAEAEKEEAEEGEEQEAAASEIDEVVVDPQVYIYAPELGRVIYSGSPRHLERIIRRNNYRYFEYMHLKFIFQA